MVLVLVVRREVLREELTGDRVKKRFTAFGIRTFVRVICNAALQGILFQVFPELLRPLAVVLPEILFDLLFCLETGYALTAPEVFPLVGCEAYVVVVIVTLVALFAAMGAGFGTRFARFYNALLLRNSFYFGHSEVPPSAGFGWKVR